MSQLVRRNCHRPWRPQIRAIRFAAKTVGIILAATITAVAQSIPNPPAAQNSNQPEALALLKNVELTYRAMNSFSAKSTNVITTNSQAMQQKVEGNMTTTVDAAGKMRIETTGAVAMLMVFDGETFWMYFSELNTYTKLPVGKEAAGAMGTGVALPDLGGATFGPNRSVATNVKDATILRAETLKVGEGDVDCWVVAVTYEPTVSPASSGGSFGRSIADSTTAKTLWIEKNHYLVYREASIRKTTLPGLGGSMEAQVSLKIESISVDPPLAADTFKFTPPDGATEMDLSAFMPKTPPSKQ